MNWWIKARRANTVLPLAMLTFAILTVAVQNAWVALPSLTGRTQVALSLFVPIPLIAATMMCLESRLIAPEVSGTRSAGLMDSCLSATTSVFALSASSLSGLLLNLPEASAIGRNHLFLLGLMLCGRALIGQLAVMLPVAWLFLVVLVGFRSPSDAYPWAIVPEPARDQSAFVAAAAVWLAGIFFQFRTSRKLS